MDVVPDAIVPDGGQNAGQHPQDGREHGRPEREPQRVRKPVGDLLDHRRTGTHRRPEVSLHRSGEEPPELDVKRLVEPKIRPNPLYHLRRRFKTRHQDCGIARNHMNH